MKMNKAKQYQISGRKKLNHSMKNGKPRIRLYRRTQYGQSFGISQVKTSIAPYILCFCLKKLFIC